MIVWGGNCWSGGPGNSGGRYDPINDTWIATSISRAPAPRIGQTTIWTGTEMIIWGGGADIYGGQYFYNTGDKYCIICDNSPSNVIAQATGPNMVAITWDSIPEALSYNVYRKYAI